ncbi:MAG: hypothetical protein ACYDH8_16895 [Syntrophales bacterium]
MGKDNKHLCEWKKGEISDELDKLKKIVGKPKYIYTAPSGASRPASRPRTSR